MEKTGKAGDRGTGVNVLAVMRSLLNGAGLDWAECERRVAQVAPMIEGSSWLETDTGRTFDLGFVPKGRD